MRFADPEQSWAILIGTASHASRSLSGLPAVVNNLADFRSVLTDPRLGGLRPEQCVVVPDPPAPPALGVQLAHLAQRAADTLIVYYTGHGLLDDRGDLFLALTDTDPGHVAYTALPLAWVRQAFADSPARNRILILDCCFSGRAIEAMASPSALVSGQIEIAGGFTLASTPANEPGHAPAGERHTAFTAELLHILRSGIDNRSEGLALGEIFLELKRAHLARGLPQPQRRVTATADRLALVRNARFPGAASSGSASSDAAAPALVPSAQARTMPRQAEPADLPARVPVPEPPWMAGIAAWRAGDLAAAERSLGEVAETGAGSAAEAACIVLGLIRRDAFKDLDAARRHLTRALLTDDPRLAALAHLHRGVVFELQGNMHEAREDYTRVLDAPDANCAALAAGRLGWLRIDTGSADEGAQVFQAGRQLGPTPARAWLDLGLADVLLHRGLPQEAARLFTEAATSGDARARGHSALGLRQICLQDGLMAEAADQARSIADNPAAVSLWPIVLSDEKPATSEGRIYAMSRWLTWFRSSVCEYVCFTSRAGPGQAIVFEKEERLTMAVLVAPRGLPRRRRGQLSGISDDLAAMGFNLESAPGEGLADETQSWLMDAEGHIDHALAVLADEILTIWLIGRPSFTLNVEFEPEISPRLLQPRPPLPELLPQQETLSPAQHPTATQLNG